MMNLVAGFFGGMVFMIVVSIHAQGVNIDPPTGTAGGLSGAVTIPTRIQAIMAGEKPNGDASTIKVDDSGRVICSEAAQK